jgi:hypothetical protein
MRSNSMVKTSIEKNLLLSLINGRYFEAKQLINKIMQSFKY